MKTTDNVNILKLGARSSVLSINHVKSHHQGNYSCEVTNRAGSAQYHIQLKIKGMEKYYKEL